MLSKVLGIFAFHSDSAYSNDDSCGLIQRKKSYRNADLYEAVSTRASASAPDARKMIESFRAFP